jgi:hypothetical protein
MTKSIKDLLPTLLLEKNNWKFTLLNSWQDIFGTLSSKVHLEKIQEDTLVLGVLDSCWLQELYLLSPVLLRTINKTLDQPRIKHLRFKTIGVKKEKAPTVLKKKQTQQVVIQLTASEQKALQLMKDQQLGQALKNYLLRCHREKE